MPLLRSPFPPAAVLVTACLFGACEGGRGAPGTPLSPDTAALDRRLVTALAWVGGYEGWGTLTEEGVRRDVTGLRLTIALDADSVRRDDCPACVTVRFPPWFQETGLVLELPDQAELVYTKGGVTRRLVLSRFSASGGTSNTMLVALEHRALSPLGNTTVLQGSFTFTRR